MPHQMTQGLLDPCAGDSFWRYSSLRVETDASNNRFYAEYMVARMVNVGGGNVVVDGAQEVLGEVFHSTWELKFVEKTRQGTIAVDAL